MFIHCTARRAFKNPNDPQQPYVIPAGYLGPVPEFVTAQQYFRLCCLDGTITIAAGSGNAAVNAAITAGNGLAATAESKREAQRTEDAKHADLEHLTRAALNTLAASKGVKDPEQLPNKAAVIEAIQSL